MFFKHVFHLTEVVQNSQVDVPTKLIKYYNYAFLKKAVLSFAFPVPLQYAKALHNRK
jgi:hypothetical protein